jgi:choline dehydrogenase-like flavoprotein
VFVCAGAVQTPHLLRRSGLGRDHGAVLRLNAVVKAVAEFPGDVHDGTVHVPPVHVHDPATGTVFGCSVSTPELVALNLAAHGDAQREAGRRPGHWLVCHASVQPDGAARVAAGPGREHPSVRFGWSARDRAALEHAAGQLVRLLLAGGAERVFLNVPGSRPFCAPGPAAGVPWPQLARLQWLASYHLSSSCPMGRHQPVDPAGRLRAEPRIVLADASVLPGPPGVNPQGTILMIAWRNAGLAVAQS